MKELAKNVKKLITYSDQGILSKEVFKMDKNDLTLFSMAKNTSLSEHTSTKEGFVYVVEGKGIFNLVGEDIIMEEGVVIHLPKNALHSLKVEENTSFLLLLIG